MKIRICVAADSIGNWNAVGWYNPGKKVTDEDKRALAIEGVGDGERVYWIEAEIPDPITVEPVIEHTISAE